MGKDSDDEIDILSQEAVSPLNAYSRLIHDNQTSPFSSCVILSPFFIHLY